MEKQSYNEDPMTKIPDDILNDNCSLVDSSEDIEIIDTRVEEAYINNYKGNLRYSEDSDYSFLNLSNSFVEESVSDDDFDLEALPTR